MLSDIILIGLLLSGFLYWYNAQRVKEIAFNATRDYCQAAGVQMLDDYIAADSLRLARDNTGKRQVQRSYAFEFASTGEHRYNGKIVMLGRQVVSIYMEPYRIDLMPKSTLVKESMT